MGHSLGLGALLVLVLVLVLDVVVFIVLGLGLGRVEPVELIDARQLFSHGCAEIDYADGVGYALHILGRCYVLLGRDADALAMRTAPGSLLGPGPDSRSHRCLTCSSRPVKSAMSAGSSAGAALRGRTRRA